MGVDFGGDVWWVGVRREERVGRKEKEERDEEEMGKGCEGEERAIEK